MSRRESTAVTYRQLQKRKSNTDHSVTVGKQTKGDLLHAVYRYSRAYVLKGTVLSIISISLLAIKSLSDITPSFLYGVLQAIIGGCLANLYVVGVNQLSDIEIDKVNKPYLPLASGELSVKTAIRITSLYAILGFCLILSVKSWHLKLCIFLWYAVGTAYSVHLPLLRWKKHHVLVAMCSWLFQGVLFPMLFHLHAQTSIHGGPLVLSKHAIFVFGIMGIHCTVLVIFKDIPDVEGDKRNGINSFPSRFGQKRVFWICIWLLETIYGIAVLVGLSSDHLWIRQIMVLGHGLLGFIVWRKANLVDLKSNEAIESFYLFIWKDILIGGTDTVTTLIEWVMAEIIQHHKIMKRVQEELEEIVGLCNIVEESHLPKLEYLHATIKETMRMHTISSLLIPRSPSKDCTVGGYNVPRGCTVFVNAWSIHRDPRYWDNPLDFNPERFLTSDESIKWDLKGNNLKFIPFGSGRRVCPGIALVEKMHIYILASLLHSFDWSLPEGEKHDLSEKFGVVVKKVKPLIAIPSQRLPNVNLYM